MNDIFLPDYSAGLVNLTNSILAHFGAAAPHPTLPEADRLLAAGHRNVVLLVLDGLGSDCLARSLDGGSFLRRHHAADISSVFPPTTVAATTSIMSGLTPVEHGWLGWSLYFPESGEIVDTFTNKSRATGRPLPGETLARRHMPYTDIFQQINDAGAARATRVSQFGAVRVMTFAELFGSMADACAGPGRNFVYGYWGEPDGCMHTGGYCGREARDFLREADARIEAFCGALRDTLLLVTADHGHLPVKFDFVSEHEALAAMLLRPTAIEPRAAAFFVRPECRGAFPAEFYRAFGREAYRLFSREEALDAGLFGTGTPHAGIEWLMGDFVAAAVSDRCLDWSREDKQFLSHHAGLTRREMQVPLIAVTIE